MKQYINHIVIALALLLAGNLTTYAAATNYGFKLGGVQVTSTNRNNIQNTSDIVCIKTSDDGYARYEPSTKTLTLYNIQIGDFEKSHSGLINESCSGLTVVFKGQCYIRSSDSGAELKASTTFTSEDGYFSSKRAYISGSDGGISVANGAVVKFIDALVTVNGNNQNSGIWLDTSNKTGAEAISIWTSCVKISGYRGIRNIPKLEVEASYVEIVGEYQAVDNLTTYSTTGHYVRVSASTPENAYFNASQKTFYSDTGSKAATMVTLDSFFPISTYFTDPAFRECIKEMNCGSDEFVTINEARQVDLIDVRNKGISSLKGIELFGALKSLYCEDNQITELNLTPFKHLELLKCKRNKIEELDFSNCAGLTHADIANNRINVENMQKLVDGLPRQTSSKSTDFIVNAQSLKLEGYEHDNACTTQQKNAIIQKGWTNVTCTDNYGLTVGGMVINTDNFNNMLDSHGVQGVSDAAVAYFDPATNELHLGDVTIYNYELSHTISLSQDKVKIVLEGGTVKLITSGEDSELYCGNTDVAICGQGTLLIEPYNHPAIKKFKSLTVGGNVNVLINFLEGSTSRCALYGCALGNDHNLGTLTVKENGFIGADGPRGATLQEIGTLNLEDGNIIVSPAGATFDGQNCQFIDSEGNIVYGQPVTLGRMKQITRIEVDGFTWPQHNQLGDYELSTESAGVKSLVVEYRKDNSTLDPAYVFQAGELIEVNFIVMAEPGYELPSKTYIFVLNSDGTETKIRDRYKQSADGSYKYSYYYEVPTPEGGLVTGIGEAALLNDNGEMINDKADGWYSLDGRQLDRKPTQKGIYLFKGKKVVVK